VHQRDETRVKAKLAMLLLTKANSHLALEKALARWPISPRRETLVSHVIFCSLHPTQKN
jgi:hypothetical protein